jgi:hypothetical protein
LAVRAEIAHRLRSLQFRKRNMNGRMMLAAFHIGNRTWSLGTRRNLETLRWKGVGGLGNDDPRDKVSDGADACEDDHERSDDADEV